MKLEGTLVIPQGWFGAKKYFCRPDIVVDTYEGEKIHRPVIYKLSLMSPPHALAPGYHANFWKQMDAFQYDGKRIKIRGSLDGNTVEALNVELC